MNDTNLAKKYHFEVLEQPTPEYSPVVKQTRFTQLDIARGIAITLMILSHCVKGLLHSSMIPDWGMIPVHLITKFSSSLFIIVFGMSISLYFIPHIKKTSWPKKRFWMIKRGIELILWYKLLTVVQMFQFYPQSMIIDTLLFKRMPDFVEILCFYSIALMWLPFVLPTWSRLGYLAKGILILSVFAIGQYLHFHFDFWGVDSLKAILVENKGYYTFGQFQRGALIFLGLLIGDLYTKSKELNKENLFSRALIITGSASLTFFMILNSNTLLVSLKNISRNIGKHPFDLNFMSFSLGGALLVLGLCMLISRNLQKFLKPISFLGQHSLNAFILHIVIIFYFYRYSFGLHRSVSYYQSLALTAACIGSVILSLYLWGKIKKLLSIRHITVFLLLPYLALSSCTSPSASQNRPQWIDEVSKKVAALEKKFDGEFGIYIKDLGSQKHFEYNADQFWYLSSTIKIPVAIATLKMVDAKTLDLKEKVTIKKSDYRDGAGSVNWIKPGKKVSYNYLLNQMLIYSDNAATDLLIARVGIKNVNQAVTQYTNNKKFGSITTLLDVRKKAYSQFHPKAENLSNFDFLSIKKQRTPRRKLNRLAKKLKIPRKKLKYQNLSAGFDDYYAQNWNSAPLTSYATLLEQLAFGNILSKSSSKKLLDILASIKTGKKRIRAGLSKSTFFSHKTGTQHRQACDVGIAGSKRTKKPKVLILVCTRKWNKLSKAEKLMSEVGKAISKTKLL